jgi:hypothetical protein
MTTLAQAVARSREDGQFVPDGPLRVGQLQAQFPHPVRNSVRDLIAAMRARSAVARPFAVIFCRFKGDAPHPDEAIWETFYREAFRAGTGGFVDFWLDASLGKVDVSGTQFFGWIAVDIARADAGYLENPPEGKEQVTRTVLTNAAIRAVQKAGGDPITGFFNQISLYMYGQTQAGIPIDGSADGDGKINMSAPFFGDVTAHEMGHSLHMRHDADVAGDTQYRDPCCVMSTGGPFNQKPWNVNFGCPVCLPHLMIQQWMYTHRMLFDGGAWADAPEGISFRLAPNASPAVPAFLGASLAIPQSTPAWSYLLEFVTATGWNRAVRDAPCLLVRRIAQRNDLGIDTPTCMFLAKLHVGPADAPTVYHDPSGHTTFTVSLESNVGPIAKVHAVRTDDEFSQPASARGAATHADPDAGRSIVEHGR